MNDFVIFMEQALIKSPEHCKTPYVCNKLTYGPIFPIHNKTNLKIENITAFCVDNNYFCEHNKDCFRLNKI